MWTLHKEKSMTTKEYLKLDPVKDKEKIQEFNKDLVKKYPWLIPGRSDEDPIPEDYDYTWMDSMPQGWRIAFGDDLLKELDSILRKYECQDSYYILQVKEKYGGLRWYDNGIYGEGYDDYWKCMDKYEQLSYKTCIVCGKPAKYMTRGWIIPICRDCAKEKYKGQKLDPIEEEEENEQGE